MTPKDDKVIRPTSDFTREALFSILSPVIVGAKVLDLFGGTGALSLESLSRGAAHVTTCDAARESIGLITKNAEMMGEKPEIVVGDYAACCRRLRGRQYDIIFLDPPYAMDIGPVLAAILDNDLAGDDTLVVYEHDQGTAFAECAPWHIKDQRRYGRVALTFITKENV